VNAIGLDDAVVKSIIAILERYPEITEARLYGSRAKGNAKAESDVDLALLGNLAELAAEVVADELEELPFPYRFDVKAYGSIKNKALKEHVDRVGKTIYRKSGDQVAEGARTEYGEKKR
jgi:uncharacterized protein